jgi:hypothetical protein
MSEPKILRVVVTRGAAGTISAGGEVQYPDETPIPFAFTGSVYGAPVAYTFRSSVPAVGWVSGFVTEPDRFGTFHDDPESWVRRYYGE